MSQRIWTAPRFGPPGPNPLADMDPPTKLSENIILNVLVKMDDTLRFSAYQSMFLIQNMRIVNNKKRDVFSQGRSMIRILLLLCPHLRKCGRCKSV